MSRARRSRRVAVDDDLAERVVGVSVAGQRRSDAAIAGDHTTAVLVEPAAQSAAAQVFKVFGGLTGQRPAGMPAADKMDKAALGNPLVVKMVRLDELQNYQSAPATDTAALPGMTSGQPALWNAGDVLSASGAAARTAR